MTRRRVVITGVGVITPVGSTLNEYWENLLAGKSGAGPVTLFSPEGFKVSFACEVKNFNPAAYIDEREIKNLDRFTQFAMASAHDAVKDSKVDFGAADRTRCGCIMGSGIGGLWEIQEQHKRFIEKGPQRLSPFFIPKMMINAAPGNIAIKYRLAGPNFSTSSACASANHAMGVSLRLIQCEDADLIVTGGSEAALTHLGLAGFSCMRALSQRNDAPQKASRPFDKDRDGFVLGEGGAAFIFEELEHAKRRGATVYAEVMGFGNSDDGYHITAPDPDGTGGSLSMARAIADAGLKPADIGYINAHGTSTQLNDKTETLAIKKVWGPAAASVPISSTKSMIGHLLGAAGAVELAATVQTLRTGVIHPTINYETPDPECDLDYVPNKPRKADVTFAISNSLGFGGHNSTLVVGRYPR